MNKYFSILLPVAIMIVLGFGCTQPIDTKTEVMDTQAEDAEVVSGSLLIDQIAEDAEPVVDEVVADEPAIDAPAQVEPEVSDGIVYTQADVEGLVSSILPYDQWREVSQWLQLDNGNIWLLTRPIGAKGDPLQANPCAAENNCPVESWIINPLISAYHLSSTQNSYLATINVGVEELDGDYIVVNWDVVVGNVSQADLSRIEYVNKIDGSMRP
ncbi:hypothetical protein HN358_01550 [Candidatus Uhrbacteria bacterium]|jgi:hypothetical protein|nr:hypothetical protein [Candidatus Uhrbacteria bacterium]MBT7717725.1 hypothetical protein [Candidatus Uhrbacteria bacterium]